MVMEMAAMLGNKIGSIRKNREKSRSFAYKEFRVIGITWKFCLWLVFSVKLSKREDGLML